MKMYLRFCTVRSEIRTKLISGTDHVNYFVQKVRSLQVFSKEIRQINSDHTIRRSMHQALFIETQKSNFITDTKFTKRRTQDSNQQKSVEG